MFNNSTLIKSIDSAQIRLINNFVNIDIQSLDVSEYTAKYLDNKKTKLKKELELYGRLLYLSLKNNQIPLNDFVLVDYGGGSGLLSFLAMELGIKTVIYNDIYDISCKDVKITSKALGLKLNHIVCGDVDDLINYLHDNSISINSITSFDVLEHIYDVESHFKKLGQIKNSSFRIIYGSGANIKNARYVNRVKKVQLDVENKTREKKKGHKNRDTLKSYFEVRSNIISEYSPNLTSNQVKKLSKQTRGLILEDIVKYVDEYLANGSTNYHIDHPTNTCDPYTGNWCEHLMDLDWLDKIVKDAGFSVEIVTGRYHSNGPLLKSIILKVLNFAIWVTGKQGFYLAPYYVVTAKLSEQI